MPLTLNTRHVGNVYVIQCIGRIVLGEDERALDAAINHAERGFCRIVLNMSGVTRIDSMGVGLLVRQSTYLTGQGGGIHLAASPSFVTDLLDLTKVSAVIRSFDTEDEAILAFHDRSVARKPDTQRGPSLLIFDPSPDLCTFARSVLAQQGFNIRTTCSFGDAKLLLRINPTDYILIGPCSTQLPSDIAAHGLAAIAPHASILQLASDFKTHEALDAARILLKMFDQGSAPQTPA